MMKTYDCEIKKVRDATEEEMELIENAKVKQRISEEQVISELFDMVSYEDAFRELSEVISDD